MGYEDYWNLMGLMSCCFVGICYCEVQIPILGIILLCLIRVYLVMGKMLGKRKSLKMTFFLGHFPAFSFSIIHPFLDPNNHQGIMLLLLVQDFCSWTK